MPHSTNQTGSLNLFVARNERQARNSGLGNDETIVGIRQRRKGRGFEEQLDVIDAQIKIVCLGKRNDQVAERQWKANLAGFGKKHYLFEHRKRHKYRVHSSFYSLKSAPRSSAKLCLLASDVMNQRMGISNEDH